MFFLTEPQVELLQKVINDYRRREVNGRDGDSLATVPQANDFYMFYLNEYAAPLDVDEASSVKARVGVFTPEGELAPVEFPDGSYWELDVYNTSQKWVRPGQWVQGHLNKSGFWVLTPPVELEFAIAPPGGIAAREGATPGIGLCQELIPADRPGPGYATADLVRTGRLLVVENWDLEKVADEGDRLIQHDGRYVVGVLCDNDGDPAAFFPRAS